MFCQKFSSLEKFIYPSFIYRSFIFNIAVPSESPLPSIWPSLTKWEWLLKKFLWVGRFTDFCHCVYSNILWLWQDDIEFRIIKFLSFLITRFSKASVMMFLGKLNKPRVRLKSGCFRINVWLWNIHLHNHIKDEQVKYVKWLIARIE